MKRRNRLVIAGFGRGATGLGRVIAQLSWQLRNNWAVSVVLFEADGSLAVPAAPAYETPARCDSVEAAAFLGTCLAGLAADVVLLVTQPWKTPRLIDSVRRAAPGARLVVYMAVEGRPAGPTIARAAARADLCVLYTRAARDSLAAQLCGVDAPPLVHIGHGLDGRTAGAAIPAVGADGRCALRRALFPDHPGLWEAPLILNASRVYPRKRLDLTIEGFARASRRSDGNLYLHLPGVIRYEADKLRDLIRQQGVMDRVVINLLDPLDRSLPFDRLVALMRASDIGLTTAMGEGWGLGTFEHAATGAAQVVPDHTGFRENWGGGAAVMVSTDGAVFVEHEAVEMAVPNVAGIGVALSSLLDDPDHLAETSRRARANALRPALTWASVGRRFDRVLSQTLLDRGARHRQRGVVETAGDD